MTQIRNKFLREVGMSTTIKKNVLQKEIGIDVGREKENGMHDGS